MIDIDLRLGRWQDCLQDVTCDALISDPPYSETTHDGMRVGNALTGSGNPYVRKGIDYVRWTPDDARCFVDAWAPRTRGWMVIVTDHWLAPVLREQMETHGRYVFAPLPFVELGKQPRLTGDGPASWTCWIVVSRPSTVTYSRWGSLDGAYVPPTSIGVQADRFIKGGKPLWLMERLVRDYSRPGDLVCDPCAGGATTLLAAAIEGRRAVGSEMDPVTHTKATKRLARGYTPVMFQTEREPIEAKAQETLFDGEDGG